ncbi:sensor histidine kinase [Streptomyces sp. NPDC054784]
MLTSWRRFAVHHPRTVEGAFLLLLFAVTAGQYRGGAHPWWYGLPLAAAACLALSRRRAHPRTAVLGTALCGAVSLAAGYPGGPLLVAPLLVALYELAARVPERTAFGHWLAVSAATAAAALVPAGTVGGASPAERAVPPAFWFLLTVVYGSAVRSRRAYLEAVRTRAELAERNREREARRRVSEERVRIARELHDVVAHHMALAHAQAGTAAHLVRNRPEQAGRILTELGGTTSAALRELRAAVGLLREPDDPAEPLEPPPGLRRLPDLVAAFGAAGLRVAVAVEGTERPLSPGVDLTAFRIVQEALTNVAKHAAVDTARVRLAYTAELLTLSVSDDGGTGGSGTGAEGTAGDGTAGGGFGLIGMRERARSAGGRLEAGRRDGGGFTVTAELPVATGPSTPAPAVRDGPVPGPYAPDTSAPPPVPAPPPEEAR